MTAQPFEFETRHPGRPLDRFVSRIWYANGTIDYARERIAPTGSTVAVLVLGDPIRQTPDDGAGPTLTAADGFVAGPHDRPVMNEPTGRTHAIGVVTTPMGCEAVFGRRPATIRGRVVPLASFWPAGSELRDALGLELRGDLSREAALERVEHALRSDLGPPPPGADRCEAAVAMLELDPTTPIAEVAVGLGMTHNQLDREFTRVVGLSPSTLARLLRLRRLLDGLDVNEDIAWADRAASLGWYDQAHLIRDFKRHTGVTPTQYVAAQRALFGAERAADAPGFVPER